MKKYFTLALSFLSFTLFAQTWFSVGGGVGNSVADYTIYNNELCVGTKNINSKQGQVKKWDGTVWDTVGASFGNGGVGALAVVNNELFAATNDGWEGQIFKWTGTNWTKIGTANKSVYIMINFNNQLIVGGSFTNINSITAIKIAKWNGASWDSLQNGLNESPNKFIVYKNELYIIGGFTKAGSQSVKYIVRWDGASWNDVGGGFVSKKAYGLYNPNVAIYNGELFVCDKNLISAGGINLNSIIARWNGSVWQNVGSGGPIDINHHCVELNGKLYCQEFVHNGKRISLWDNTNWTTLNVNNSIIDTMFISDVFVFDNELYNIGEIYLNGFNAEGIVKLDLPVSIDENDDNTDLFVYPNPTRNTVKVIRVC